MAIETAITIVKEKLQNLLASEEITFNPIHSHLDRSIKCLKDIEGSLKTDDQGSWRTDSWAVALLQALYNADDAVDTYFFGITTTKRKGFLKVFSVIHLKSLRASFSKKMKDFLLKLEEVTKDLSKLLHQSHQSKGGYFGEDTAEPSILDAGGNAVKNPLCERSEQLGINSDEESDTYNLRKISTELVERVHDCYSSLFVISVVDVVSSRHSNLLRNIFDDANTKKHFECHAWVDVPEVYDQEELLSNMMEQVTSIKEMKKSPLDSLKENLKKFLMQRRFLVVLDGVRAPDFWTILRSVLPNSFNGSWVILAFNQADAQQLQDSEFYGTVDRLQLSLGSEVVPELVADNQDVKESTDTRVPDEEIDIIGRENETEQLCQLTSDNELYFIIAVVGKAGSGKTTLVKKFYNSLIREKIEYHAWICVSKIYDEKNMLIQIVEQLTQDKDEGKWSWSLEALRQEIREFLAPKRYLIILDDVHTADVWNQLKLVLPNSFNGSRVILTVREADVADSIDSSDKVQLNSLNDDESWTLFTKKVGKDRADEASKNLKEKILQNCQGLPLAICLLGGFLLNKKTSEWPKMIENINPVKQEEKKPESMKQKGKKEGVNPANEEDRLSGPEKKKHGEFDRNEHQKLGRQAESVPDEENRSISRGQSASSDELGPLTILALGYQGLRPSLRACLSYLCLFPKSEDIPIRRVSLLWLAEGLVTPLQTDFQVKEYLRTLEEMNMVEVTRRLDGEPKTCRVTSTVYDKFNKIAHKTGFFNVLLNPNSESNTSRSTNFYRLVQYSDIGNQSVSKEDIQHLRTYISFDSGKGDKPADAVGKLLNKTITERGYGLVRVLDLEGVYKPELSETLRKLPLLKYVGLRQTFLDSIPESIGDLRYLETLDVKHTSITMLPITLWKATNLRYLYMDGIHLEMKDGKLLASESLTNLQTLMGLFIGNRSPIINWLKELTGLRKLGLTCHTASIEEIITNWISRLTELQSLKLRSKCEVRESALSNSNALSKFSELTDLYLVGKLPPALINITELPTNLKVLTLSLSLLSDDPMEVLGQLNYLSVLRLRAYSYIGDTMHCPSGGFRELRLLRLWMLKGLKQWTIEEGAMPTLTELEIRHCHKLEKPDGLEKVTTLKRVTLTNMKEAFVNEVKESIGNIVKQQELEFCPSWSQE